MKYNRAEPPPLQLLDSSSAISEGCPKSRVIVCLSHPSYVLCCLFVTSVVLQGSLHVEEPQPGEAGRVLGRLGQARRLLTVLWNRGPHPHPPVHQPSVRDGFCHKAPQKKKESVCSMLRKVLHVQVTLSVMFFVLFYFKHRNERKVLHSAAKIAAPFIVVRSIPSVHPSVRFILFILPASAFADIALNNTACIGLYFFFTPVAQSLLDSLPTCRCCVADKPHRVLSV